MQLLHRSYRRHRDWDIALRCTYCSEELATTDGLHCVYCGALLSDPMAKETFIRETSAPDEPATLAMQLLALVATFLIGLWLLARWSERKSRES